MSSTVPMSSTVKVTPETGKVPGLGGENFFYASEPAKARIGTIIRKRPTSIARPSVTL